MMKACDLFSGLGGFTEGAAQAGVRVTFAANHWPAAVEWHRRNHPEVHHECQDLQQMDMRILPRGGLLLAAPACQGFSTNGQPSRVKTAAEKHQADRNTTYAVLAACDTARPQTVVVENVPRFLKWSLFPSWRGFLEAMGYHVRTHVLRTQDYGSPQDRARMILTGSLRAPLTLEPSSGRQPGSIGACLQEAHGQPWNAINSKPSGMVERMRRAQQQAGRLCLWANVDSARGRPLDELFPTITTKSIGQLYLLDGDDCRLLSTRELARAQSFPDHYQLPTDRTLAGKLIGNAIDVNLAAGVIAQAAAA